MRTLLSVLASLVAILACGALVALFVAMIVATAAWALGMAVLRAARILR